MPAAPTAPEARPPAPPGADRGLAARLCGWLSRRFGPLDLAAPLLLALAAESGAAALARPGPLPRSGRAVAAAAFCVLLALYLRLSDDLKDWETDRRLAAEGDARFTGRPQVRGEVTPADLRLARAAVAAGLGALLATQQAVPALVGGVAVLLAWLSARWYFRPAMARSLPQAFASHNPIGLVTVGFAAAAGQAAAGGATTRPVTLALVVGLYLPVAAWEIARKVRTPSEETGYQTWSAVLGLRAAALLPAGLAAASSALLAGAARAADLPGWYGSVAAAAALAPALAALALLGAPSPAAAARLRLSVESHALLISLGLLAATVAGRGLGVEP